MANQRVLISQFMDSKMRYKLCRATASSGADSGHYVLRMRTIRAAIGHVRHRWFAERENEK